MFGAIYGDIIGSYYENHCTKDYDFKFQKDSYFTDDSVLIAAVCCAIINDQSKITRFHLNKRAREYAACYRQFYTYYPYAGFGQMFSAWAKNPYAGFGHSYANGASMRVMPIAYFYDDFDQMKLQVKASCLPTHNNKEAIRCATAVASAIWMARHGKTKSEIREYIEKNFFELPMSIEELRKTHLFDCRSSYSVPPAIVAFLESNDYESAVRYAVSLGGDADTQACIAGGIAEAYYREIPENIRKFCEPKLEMTIKSPVIELMKIINNR